MENKEFAYVYPYSRGEAKRLKELDDWKQSHKENVACRKAIESAITEHFDGRELKEGCAERVIEAFGYHRTAFVLANSLKQRGEDGISSGSMDWAKGFYIPMDMDDKANYNLEYAAANEAQPLDCFTAQYRSAHQRLGLLDHTHCLPDTSKQDFEGKVIVLSTRGIKESCLTQQSQLWLCTGGFGSHPNSRGRAVFATNLGDGETARLNREDITGVLADSHLPDWAREKLEQLQSNEQTATEHPDMGGMTMQ